MSLSLADQYFLKAMDHYPYDVENTVPLVTMSFTQQQIA